MQHDVPTEVVLDEGDIQQPHIDAIGRKGQQMRGYDPRDVAIMYRMEREIVHQKWRAGSDHGTLHPKFMTLAWYMRTRRIWAKICQIWKWKRDQEEEKVKLGLYTEEERPTTERETLEEYITSRTSTELEELSKRARLDHQIWGGNGAIVQGEVCRLRSKDSQTRSGSEKKSS